MAPCRKVCHTDSVLSLPKEGTLCVSGDGDNSWPHPPCLICRQADTFLPTPVYHMPHTDIGSTFFCDKRIVSSPYRRHSACFFT